MAATMGLPGQTHFQLYQDRDQAAANHPVHLPAVLLA
jgi:hypothetical protein